MAIKGMIKGEKFLVKAISKVKKGICYMDAVDTNGKLKVYYPENSFAKVEKYDNPNRRTKKRV